MVKHMKVVIAIDSFKGSLSSMEAGRAAAEGVRRAVDANVVIRPLADGGEGTTEALISGLGGTYQKVEVTGPLGEKVMARYGILADGKTAVMEMAEAAGITLVDRSQLNPWKATTYGVGEMILDGIHRGCREFIMGIGGSATSDGGVGMLQALGYHFYNQEGCPIGPGLGDLDQIAEIRGKDVEPLLKECHFQIACDVKNPLCGENGAVYIFGPQKGVKEEEKEILDRKTAVYADKTAEFTGKDRRKEEGAGAAGGLGFAFLSYFPHVELQPGISIVLKAVGLEQELMDADVVITGEGCLDEQTAMGKLPVGVAHLAKKYHAMVLAFAGSIKDGGEICNKEGIDAVFPIVRGVTSLEEAMKPETAKKNMTLAVEQVFRLISCR